VSGRQTLSHCREPPLTPSHTNTSKIVRSMSLFRRAVHRRIHSILPVYISLAMSGATPKPKSLYSHPFLSITSSAIVGEGGSLTLCLDYITLLVICQALFYFLWCQVLLITEKDLTKFSSKEIERSSGFEPHLPDCGVEPLLRQQNWVSYRLSLAPLLYPYCITT
jgi:hypothetical protein